MNNISILMYFQSFIFVIVTFYISFYLMLQIKNSFNNKIFQTNIYFITIRDLKENKEYNEILEIIFTETTKHMKKEILDSEITAFKYKIFKNNIDKSLYINTDVSIYELINIKKI